MLTLILSALAGSGPAAPGPCPALPLTPRTTWSYRAKVVWSEVGGTLHRQTIRWTTTVLTLRLTDSTAIATVRGWPTNLAWWQLGRAPTVDVLVCGSGRVYHLRPASGAATRTLVDSLLQGTRRPALDELILQLPLRSGQLFGRDSTERGDTFYAWLVESAEPIPPRLRRLQTGLTDSLYSLVYRTNPDHQLVGFVPGLGVTRYVYGHRGTVADAEAQLVAFRKGRPRN